MGVILQNCTPDLISCPESSHTAHIWACQTKPPCCCLQTEAKAWKACDGTVTRSDQEECATVITDLFKTCSYSAAWRHFYWVVWKIIIFWVNTHKAVGPDGISGLVLKVWSEHSLQRSTSAGTQLGAPFWSLWSQCNLYTASINLMTPYHIPFSSTVQLEPQCRTLICGFQLYIEHSHSLQDDQEAAVIRTQCYSVHLGLGL